MGMMRRRAQGVTLIELIIAIVVLGIASVGILTALGRTTVLNVDPLIRAQSLALAQSFMDEVAGKPFYPPALDPQFDTNATPPIDPCASSEMPDLSTLADRSTGLAFVCAFNDYRASDHEGGLATPNGEPISGLSGYDVSIAVLPDPDGGILGDLDENCVLRITVEVDDPTGATTRLHSYRASAWEDCQ